MLNREIMQITKTSYSCNPKRGLLSLPPLPLKHEAGGAKGRGKNAP